MPKSKVILVGAGPGDEGLLTLKGLAALEQADVVLFDKLVSEDILALIPPQAELIDVGKSCGNHSIPQDEINAILLEKAKENEIIVRLKGGDPYLFGRGTEEIRSLIEAGIDFEVVPGVTSAIAVPAYAGIPVTHRDFSSSLHIITGHSKAGVEREIDFESLVKLDGTLVFLMSISVLENICAGLIAAGMRPEMPAAIIENGTCSCQRKLIATVSTLAKLAREQNFAAPAVIVVGKVCALSESYDWFSRQPLFGVNVLVTRPKSDSKSMSGKLRALGCGVTELPCAQIVPLDVPDSVFERLRRYNWIIFTSATGARLFFSELTGRGYDIRTLAGIKFAAVGSETAKEIARRGIHVDFVPQTFSSGHLAAILEIASTPGEKLLLFRAAAGSADLPETLSRHGFIVEDVHAYETEYNTEDTSKLKKRLESGDFDFVTFTSASTVTGFVKSMQGIDFNKINGVCIGEKTAECARNHGIKVSVSKRATIDSIIELIIKLAEGGGKTA